LMKFHVIFIKITGASTTMARDSNAEK